MVCGTNCRFIVSGWVEDEKGQRLTNVRIMQETPTIPCPGTDSKTEYQYFDSPDGSFSLDISGVGGISLRCGSKVRDLGGSIKPRTDWLGRAVYERHGIRLITKDSPDLHPDPRPNSGRR